jgi:hypothetical protein
MALFDDAEMVVQEVDTANDIGKDLYVDLADEGRFTGELVALQVKAGVPIGDLMGRIDCERAPMIETYGRTVQFPSSPSSMIPTRTPFTGQI